MNYLDVFSHKFGVTGTFLSFIVAGSNLEIKIFGWQLIFVRLLMLLIMFVGSKLTNKI